MKTKSLLIGGIVVGSALFALPSYAQRGTGDAEGVASQSEKPPVVTLSGELKSIETGPCKHTTGRATVGTHLHVQTADGPRNIHLGPAVETESIVEQLQVGQSLTVEAFRTDQLQPDHYVAKAIQFDDKRIELRDAGLRPKWAGGGDGAPGNGRLSPDMEKTLLHMREEEKLARDVYLTLGKKYSTRMFSRIAGAESRHMAALEILTDRYGLDPPKDDTIGTFTQPEFTRLYNELVESGSQSLADAYRVGALVEELDIADLQAGIKEAVAVPDVERVYQNLMRGSRNHLRAFAAQLNDLGETYEAKHLSQEEFDRIANSPWERGGRGGRGRRPR